MSKRKFVFVMFLLLALIKLHAQNSLPLFKAQNFRSIELKTGIGLLPRNYTVPVDVIYQQNIKGGFSAILHAGLLVDVNNNTQFDYREFSWLAEAGVGRTIGNGRFNNGLYLLGGGRFYHSKLELKDVDFEQDTLVTTSITPELGLLYNLKFGKKKFYFATQIYVALTPIKNFTESRHTLMFGFGYRLENTGKKSAKDNNSNSIGLSGKMN